MLIVLTTHHFHCRFKRKKMETKDVADFLFEGRLLKKIPRSGFQFLGDGKESVAEHCFSTTLIAYVISRLEPDINVEKLLSLCLVHDLAEARVGDLNYVQKMYVTVDENKAVSHMTRHLPFGDHLAGLIDEFNQKKSKEAQLAHDADQLALILELKNMSDLGKTHADKWLVQVIQRLVTDVGKYLADAILNRKQDSWWLKDYHENWPNDSLKDET
jgi:putative hydrolases of HD superfamily